MEAGCWLVVYAAYVARSESMPVAAGISRTMRKSGQSGESVDAD